MSRDFIGDFNVRPGMEFAHGVTLVDDFEGTLQWAFVGTGGDDVHEVVPLAAYSGTHGVRMKTRTASAAADDFLVMGRIVPYPESGLSVMRVMFKLMDMSAVKYIKCMQAWYRDGTVGINEVRLYPNTPKLDYRAPGGDVTITGYDFTELDEQWHVMETVLDLGTLKLVEVALGGIRTSVDAAIYEAAAGNTNRLGVIDVRLETIGAAAAEVYVDSVYLGGHVGL